MAIRPIVEVTQETQKSAPNILGSLMKGMLVGPALQDENAVNENLNVSATHGSLATILDEASQAVKLVSTVGLINGAKVDFNSLSFAAEDAVVKLDFSGKTYTGLASEAGIKHKIILDVDAALKVGKSDLLSAGAEVGDYIDVSFDVAGTITKERHKIRDYIVDSATGDTTLQLWDNIVDTSVSETTELTITHYKNLKEVSLNVLAPLEIIQNSNSYSVYSMNNTTNPTDGGFSTNIYIYSPVSNAEGVTFANQIISTEPMDLFGFTETKKVAKVIDGRLFNLFVANRTDLSNNVFEVTTQNYKSKLGKPTAKNKLSYAMQLIDGELAGGSMKVYVTEDDSLASYSKAFAAIVSQDKVYSITPLTDDPVVLSQAVSMVKQAAKPTVAKYKLAVLGPRTPYYTSKIKTNDFTIIASSGDLFKVTIPNGGFLSQGTSIGDFVFDSIGFAEANESYYRYANETYSNKVIGVIESITTDDVAIVRATTSGSDLVALLSIGDINIGAINTNQDLIDSVKARASNISHKNVSLVFPDKAEVILDDEPVIVPGYFVAAITNAAMAHVVPQQGLSNMSLLSLRKIYGSSFLFSDGELDDIASGGNLVLLQKNYSEKPYFLRQLTTNIEALETMEINKVRCLDYATFAFASVLSAYVGRRNVTDSNIEEISRKLGTTGKVLISSTKNAELGSVILSFEVVDVYVPEGEKDAVHAVVDVVTPTSMNKIRLFVSSK